MSFYFTSEYYRETRAGFDFVVSVEDASTLHTVSIAPVENGSMDMANNDQLYFGDTIFLTANPNNGYLLKDISVDAGGRYVEVIKENLLAKNATVKVIMPSVDLEITPIFATTLTAEDEVFVTTPVIGHKTIEIPAGVTSFKVYDDGGPKNGCSANATGFLELVAPENYAFQITGTVSIRVNSRDCIYGICWQ